MYVHSVGLVNFKSFGESQGNLIVLERNVTAIIGKNESGKSNVLDGLSRITFLKRNNNAFSEDVINRSVPMERKYNKYIVTLKPSDNDKIFDGLTETIIEISKEGHIVKGGFLEYYLQKIYPEIEEVLGILGNANSNALQLRDQEFNSYKNAYNCLQNKTKIDILTISSSLEFIQKRVKKIDESKQVVLQEKIEIIQRKWNDFAQMLPIFYYRYDNKHLKQNYTYEEIERELNNSDSIVSSSLLKELVHVIDIAKEDFLSAAKTGHSSNQVSLRQKIIRTLKKKIDDPFNTFYKTEEVHLNLEFNNGNVTIAVQSNDGESLLISERSNGLKWYLETFIDAQANNIPEKNVVYLFDEPGISLHVNAQRELLKLFRKLTDNGNQVVYTTHSPYLLDTEKDGLHKIRAIVKDSEGISYIHNSAYAASIAPESQKETLAPIINALGMNLYDTFGPANGKINIVVEGISDYIYICTMAKLLNVDSDKYAIIPSVGATNVVHVCSILHGWGCRYIAVFDYDKEGVESGGEYMRKKMYLEYERHYCYIKEVTHEEIMKKTYTNAKYMIEDMVSGKEINRFCNERNFTKESKTLTAKLMCREIEDGRFVLAEESVNNFKTFFERIVRYCS